MSKVLLALSSASPPELAAPVEAALAARDLEVRRIDLGRIAGGSGVLDRVVQAVTGEVERRRLERELEAFAPDVVVALDAPATAVLVRERDRAGAARPAPVIGVASELAPQAGWVVDADRFCAVDDEAAVALSELGVDGARVHVVGPVVRHAWSAAGRESRAELRARFKLPAEAPVLLVEAGRLGDAMSQLLLQLSLLSGPPHMLFDAAGDADAAAMLRRQAPALGLKAKLFGDIPDAPLLWRAADVVVARARPRALLQALAAGAAFCAIEPEGEQEAREAKALEERGLGVTAAKVLFFTAAMEPLLQGGHRAAAVASAEARRGPGDAADEIAKLVMDVAARREEVLAETAAARGEREAAEGAARAAASAARAAASAGAGALEDLGGDDEDGGAAPGVAGAGPGVAAEEARLRKQLAEARAEAERWEQRRALAEQKGQTGLAAEAAREAERKRARMHAVLEELARLAGVRGGSGGAGAESAPTPSTSPPRDVEAEIAAMKREAERRVQSVDDELAALKRKMQTEKAQKKK